MPNPIPVEDTAYFRRRRSDCWHDPLVVLSIMVRENTARGFVRSVRKLSGLR